MKNIAFIYGSPKMDKFSCSREFLGSVMAKFDDSYNKIYIDVPKSIINNSENDDFQKLINADALILCFPLYFYCLPGVLMRFLQDYYKFYNENSNHKEGVKIYAIVNCGFPEANICTEAVRVIESFSRHIHADFRFGIMSGCGGMMIGAKNAPFMKETENRLDTSFSAIEEDILTENKADEKYISISIPVSGFFKKRLFYSFMGHMWNSDAVKNGLKKADIYRRPY